MRTLAAFHSNDSLSKRSLLERTLDALPDGVLLTNTARNVVYANAAFGRLWNMPPEMLASTDELLMLQYIESQLLDAEGFVREAARISSTTETLQDELHLRDWRVLSRRSVAFEPHGQSEARIWIFTDITEARHARIDTLCGLPNRRAYTAEFPLFAAAADDGLVRSVALMDIDNFKSYNDNHGHDAGDGALRSIGALLRGRFPNNDDLAFRIGGEEFLLACKSHKASDAVMLFEALRESIAAMVLPHTGNPPHNVVTASFGMTQFQGPQNPVTLFKAADAALYAAKADGRNRISVVGEAKLLIR